MSKHIKQNNWQRKTDKAHHNIITSLSQLIEKIYKTFNEPDLIYINLFSQQVQDGKKKKKKASVGCTFCSKTRNVYKTDHTSGKESLNNFQRTEMI